MYDILVLKSSTCLQPVFGASMSAPHRVLSVWVPPRRSVSLTCVFSGTGMFPCFTRLPGWPLLVAWFLLSCLHPAFGCSPLPVRAFPSSQATYKGRTRRLTMRKSPNITVSSLETSLLDLFNITRPSEVSASSPGRVQGVPKSASLTGVAGSNTASGGGGSAAPGGSAKGMMSPDEMLRSALGGREGKAGGGDAPSTPLTTLEITYTDAEGDLVSLVDDRDVRDALFFQKLNPLRLNVSLPSPPTALAPTPKVAQAAPAVRQEEEGEDGEEGREEGSLRVHFRSEGVELRESAKAASPTLDRTVAKVCDLVSEAVHARSSLVLEIQFHGSALTSGVPGADAGAVNGHVGNGEASALAGSQFQPQQQSQHLQQVQQQALAKNRAAVPSPLTNPVPAPRGIATPTSRGGVATPPSDQHADLSMLLDTSSLTSGGVPAPLALPPHIRPYPSSASNGGGALTVCAVCKMSPIHGPRYQSIL